MMGGDEHLVIARNIIGIKEKGYQGGLIAT
jgi:hypothetical protein